MEGKAKPDKLICWDSDSSQETPNEDIKKITHGSFFLFEQEHRLCNILAEVFYEMSFLINQFKQVQNKLLNESSPNIEYFINGLNEVSFGKKNIVVEFHSIPLSVYFKSFLILSKSVLDKLVPFYSYRFKANLRSFDKKGTRLIEDIKRNKQTFRKNEMIDLIKQAKGEWLDSLIDLRDEYVHYSDLEKYDNFWLSLEEWVEPRQLKDLTDLNKPTVEVAGQKVQALEYMEMTKGNLVLFLGNFIQLCDFTSDRRPKISLRCIGCPHVFAKKDFPKKGQLTLMGDFLVEIKDRSKDYAVIICPKCGEKTDTDLKFWPPQCFQNT